MIDSAVIASNPKLRGRREVATRNNVTLFRGDWAGSQKDFQKAILPFPNARQLLHPIKKDANY